MKARMTRESRSRGTSLDVLDMEPQACQRRGWHFGIGDPKSVWAEHLSGSAFLRRHSTAFLKKWLAC